MNKLILGLGILTVVACAPEKEGSGGSPNYSLNVTLPSPTTEITADNAVDMLNLGMSALDIDTPADDFEPFGETSTANTRNITPRASETEIEYCTSGNLTITVSSDSIDENTEVMPTNGELRVTTVANNCEEYYSTIDGTMTMDMSWKGYSSATEEPESVAFRVLYDNFTVTSGTETVSIEGGFVAQADQNSVSTEFRLSIAASDTSDSSSFGITMETTSPITILTNDYQASSGAWRVSGANGTYLEATYVANGVEYSVNGEPTTTLLTWSEIDF